MPETIEEAFAEAVTLHRGGNLDEAEDFYRAVLDADPEHADATNLLGVLAADQGYHDEAVELIGQAIGYQPENPFYFFSLGNVFMCQDLYEDAVVCYEQSLELDPNQGVANQNLAAMLRHQGKFEEAERACAHALELLPETVEVYHLYSEILRDLGRHPEAVDICRKALALDSNNDESHNMLGNALKNVGDVDGAVAAFGVAMNLLFGLDRPDRPGDVLSTQTTHGKLEHDIQQITYLMEKGLLGDEYEDVVRAYSEVLDDLPPPEADGVSSVELPPHLLERIAPTYNRILHITQAPMLGGPAVNPDLDGAALEALYQKNGPGYVCFDDLLTPEALESLRRFCLESTIWFHFRYSHGRVATLQGNGFFTPLLAQISEEMRSLMPNVFGDHRLNQAWGYKYNTHPQGINEHADFAAVNVNFWITPDEANQDPESGGLVVWDKPAPMDWTFAQFNQDQEGLRKFIAEEKAKRIVFAHRQNRVVIFNSNLVHMTDTLNFKPGYENHRINVTMLFGDRKTA